MRNGYLMASADLAVTFLQIFLHLVYVITYINTVLAIGSHKLTTVDGGEHWLMTLQINSTTTRSYTNLGTCY